MSNQPTTMPSGPNKQGVFYKRHGKGGLDADIDDKFDVVVPKGNKILLIAIFIILFACQYVIPSMQKYWYIPIAYLGVCVIPIFLWGKLGAAMAEGNILKWLRKTVQNKKNSVVEIVEGFPTRVMDPYYIEANPIDLDLGSDAAATKVFLNRVKEVLFLSIGICTLLSQTLAPSFFPAMQQALTDNYNAAVLNNMNPANTPIEVVFPYVNQDEFIIDTTIFLGPFALILLFPIMPLLWITEDMQIYRVNEVQDPFRLGTYLRNGLLSKILGFFGIVLAFKIAYSFASGSVLRGEALELMKNTPGLTLDAALVAAQADGIDMMQVLIQTGYQFAMILLSGAALPFLVALVYLAKFHGVYVNNIRIKASEFIPSATIRIIYAPANELTVLTHPEKLKEIKKDFLDTTGGKVLLFGMALVAFAISFYIGFIWVG